MLSRSQVFTRLSKLRHYHLISYHYQANQGYHVVTLRCKAVKFPFPISTEVDHIVKVNDSGKELLAVQFRPPFCSFLLDEHGA